MGSIENLFRATVITSVFATFLFIASVILAIAGIGGEYVRYAMICVLLSFAVSLVAIIGILLVEK